MNGWKHIVGEPILTKIGSILKIWEAYFVPIV